jgi:hypothetical protein
VSQELSAIVTLGPESAEALGVPVGTTVDYGVLAYWHRNPLKRLWRRIGGGPRPSQLDIRLARAHQAYAAARVAEEAKS